MVVSGRAVAAMDDGKVGSRCAPATFFFIPPGHAISWVVGEEPECVPALQGAADYVSLGL